MNQHFPFGTGRRGRLGHLTPRIICNKTSNPQFYLKTSKISAFALNVNIVLAGRLVSENSTILFCSRPALE